MTFVSGRLHSAFSEIVSSQDTPKSFSPPLCEQGQSTGVMGVPTLHVAGESIHPRPQYCCIFFSTPHSYWGGKHNKWGSFFLTWIPVPQAQAWSIAWLGSRNSVVVQCHHVADGPSPPSPWPWCRVWELLVATWKGMWSGEQRKVKAQSSRAA